jgi:hypothetical protein
MKPYISLNSSLVHNLIEIVGCYARPDLAGGRIEDFAGQAAHLAHGVLLLLVENGNLVSVGVDLLGFGNAIVGVVGELDVRGDFASWSERVYGPDGAGVLKVWKGVIVSGFCIRLRNDLGREDIVEATLRFMDFLVLVLSQAVSIRLIRE